MSSIKQCVILNPNAGTAQKVQAGLETLGPHTVFESQKPGDATRLAREAVEQGFERVIAAGGDGTLNEVLNGLSSAFGKVQLGLIPVGTANDFARSAHIPTEVDQAIEVLRAAHTIRADVIRMTICDKSEPHYLINVSAGGFSTLVAQNLDEETKSWWGPLGYALTAVKALPELTTYNITVRLDDEEPVTVPVYNVVVANATHVGGNIPVAPKARIDDGLFDVVLFRAVPAARLAILVPKAMLGQHVDDEDVAYRQVRRLEISSDPPFEMNADGEIVGLCPATYEIVPGALEVIVGTDPQQE